MIYQRKEPSKELKDLIDCFWIVDSEGDSSLFPQKIIPDGFPELIFHYGDTYRINISGNWEVQCRNLIAGQLTKFFYLENTGVSGMIGVKMKPWAIHSLFQLEMSKMLDQVLDLKKTLPSFVLPKPDLQSFDAFCNSVESLFLERRTSKTRVKLAVELIIDRHGMLNLSDLSDEVGVSNRQLERWFKTEVGISPKLYARIIRLNYIFHQVEQRDFSWAQLAYKSGFTDQSHFIKNFKEFTGEDPTKYNFDHPDMANFFMKK
ncbi:MAG: hypothetical protein CMB80_23605 [Flammeovirgaceae bacterium]|nr:hypothetical protein [Flammeovirgaceae bacterium]MBE63419.1 hypothetical protein [Flammeovirgaceae bacterium]MBR08323.1 hypothetical protein [Rickettsiales bacterium]HCX22828.1 hypothetical protein [Cytophagales bacterium]|tara:strand:+ start:239 stop:1021 length:783 start_codon:yes stop_codon:yes gene_type:complete